MNILARKDRNYTWISRSFKKWRDNYYWKSGSDATAVAIAKIFQTETCEIYTDVDGVYSPILIKYQ